MRVIRCPHCDEPLPGFAKYCAACGEPLLPSVTGSTASTGRLRRFKIPRFYAVNDDEATIPFAEYISTAVTMLLDGHISTAVTMLLTGHISTEMTIPLEEHISTAETISLAEDSSDEETVKLVRKGPPFSQRGGVLPGQIGGAEEDFRTQQASGNWHKVVAIRSRASSPSHPAYSTSSGRTASSLPATPVPLALLPSTPVPVQYSRERRKPSPFFFGVSLLLLGAIICGGLLGVIVTLGHGALAQLPRSTEMTLQVTPASVALGATITLRGSNFSPFGRVGLTRDNNIPVFDTVDATIISADRSGSISDTVIVDANWLAGTHVIRAEDARLHKIAAFTILVTGHSPSLRPAHLILSSSKLDLGSGDSATNSTKTITLTNAGGGEISWQAATTQPWLLLSPKSGTFFSGQAIQVTIAADRSNLRPGAFAAQAIFTSNAGGVALPVSMKTTRLEVGHEPVLQLTPAVLAFNGVDGGNSPPAQVVTVSNPGALPLSWNAVISGGNGWLSLSTEWGRVAKSSSEAVVLDVNSSMLLPGTYYASVNFSSVGAARNSPQSIYVSLTIVPQCTLQIAPGLLSFTGVYLQPAPAAKIVSLNVPQGCTAPLYWSASISANISGYSFGNSHVSGVPWLSMASSSGITPSYPAVSVSLAGLQPGTYTADIIFSAAMGTETLPVSLSIGPPTTPIIAVAPAALTFNAISGQPSPAAQAMTISNTGGGVLSWQAVASTNIGGAWLSLAATKGTLTAHQATSVNVMATLLQGLTPNTYTGMITVTGVDGYGHSAVGSPQSIPVNFVVSPPCTIAETPATMTFTGVMGQPNPAVQPATISANGSCFHTLDWVATSDANWLSATPASGTVSLTAPATTNIGVSLAGLQSGVATGHVTISAVDSVTHLAIGVPQTITVTLTLQAACTLQAASPSKEIFSSEAGTNPATQSFTIGIMGACIGAITITPTVTQSWLSISPSSATITSGSATFTTTVNAAALAVGSYSDSISLAAVTSSGFTINGSPQTVGVTLTVAAAPSLSVGPVDGGLVFNLSTGTVAQTITISNGGGEPLNWTATLAPNAPSFLSLAASGGTNLGGGSSATDNVIANVTGIPGGSTFTTSATVSAIDPLTGKVVVGSPATVPITINVALPAMILNTNVLSFTTTVGVNPASQAVLVTNIGGDGLTWTAGTPSQPWLTLGLSSGSDNSGATSTIPFNVSVAGMVSGTYTATVVITPSVGAAQTVTVTLQIT